MKFSNFRNSTSIKLTSYVIIQILLLGFGQGVYAETAANYKRYINVQTLSPRVIFNSAILQDFISTTLSNRRQSALFGIPKDKSHELTATVNYLNTLLFQKTNQEAVDIVLSDPNLEKAVSAIIRAQDRMESVQGLTVDRAWAEQFKEKALKNAVDEIEERDIFFLQMEYELSTQFLEAFKKHLITKYLMHDNGMSYKEAEKLAVYATGQLAKLQMAGGLGSFKPDWVKGFYDNLKKYWGAKKAREKLHVMGVFYAKAIKGEGELARDEKLDLVVDKIRKVKHIENNFRQRIRGQSELVYVALDNMEEIVTYNIPVNMNGFKDVNVVLYRNPYSELNEYWMYCPEIFHEAYPGNSDDEFRPVQTFVYREVLMRYMEYLAHAGKISKKIIISDSETSTALANPQVTDQNLDRYPKEKRAQYERIFKQFSELDILYHKYNHTIVPAGMGTFPVWKFGDLKIKQELSFIKQKEAVDLKMIAGETHDIITGCSTAHTQIMRDHPDLYKYFEHKIKEDDLFGNSEGSDVARWQGREIRSMIEIFMKELNAKTYDELFRTLETDPAKKDKFILAIKIAKRMQKEWFIKQLFKGTFGELDVTLDELEKDGVNLLDRPFFTFVRRMVPYKCSDRIVDMIENFQSRERIIKSGAVIIIGGRKFDDFAQLQHRRIQELIKQDPRLRSNIIFISNHNVATSWIMQQGTDFGGMLSWEGMEAGPTSPSNAGLNWTNLFSSPDGVMIERLRKVQKDKDGNVIFGTGHIVKYGNERASNAMKSRLPDKESFLSEMEIACVNYFNGRNYDLIAFNNMWLQMTQGDIRTQTAGNIMVMADALKERKAYNDKVNLAIDKFVSSQSSESIQKIVHSGDNGVREFNFKQGWPKEAAIAAGLEPFLAALEYNTEQGYIYVETIDFINYVRELIKNKPQNKLIIDILEQINGTSKHYSALTPYEKQKAFIKILKLIVKRSNKDIPLFQEEINKKNYTNTALIELAI